MVDEAISLAKVRLNIIFKGITIFSLKLILKSFKRLKES